MSRRPWRFAPLEIKRAIRLMRDSGLQVSRVEIGPDGTIRIDTTPPSTADGESNAGNPWDEVPINAADEKRPS